MGLNNIKSKIIGEFFTPYFLLNQKKFQNCILMYHGISNILSPFYKRHALKKHFIQQLNFLKKYCNVITLEDYFNQNFKPNKINVALTFDDGYWNNFSIAKPLLEEAQLPAHFFITGINENNNLNDVIPPILWADFIEIASKLNLSPKNFKTFDFSIENNRLIEKSNNQTIHQIIKHIYPDFNSKKELFQSFDHIEVSKIFRVNKEFWQLMNEKEIKQTSKSKYITIGSHGYFHNNLGNLSNEENLFELKTSKDYLENLIQKEVNSIAYPDGSYSISSIEIAEKLGFNYQLATDSYLFNENQNDHRILTRKGIYEFGNGYNQLYNALII